MIATSSSDAKLEVAKQLGAAHVVNYRTCPSWENEILKVTDGQGADIAVETVAGPNVEHTVKAVRRGGVVAFVGMLSGHSKEPVHVMPDLWYGSKTSKSRRLRACGYWLIEASIVQGMIGTGSKEMAHELVAFVQEHNLHPPIAQTFQFEQAQEAWEALARLNKPGKIVITV